MPVPPGSHGSGRGSSRRCLRQSGGNSRALAQGPRGSTTASDAIRARPRRWFRVGSGRGRSLINLCGLPRHSTGSFASPGRQCSRRPSPTGTSTRARYDTSRRRWRHLDFGACQVWLEADIHRIDCRSCSRVRTEQVPWARPNARHTTDFENVAAWLAQRMDKARIARLLRCSWEAVDAIVTRVVADHIDDARLDRLYQIGVDGWCPGGRRRGVRRGC
jgi:Helix-turn-helix domain of transposase family ISL3